MKFIYATIALLAAAVTAAPAETEARQADAPTEFKKYIELHSFKWTGSPLTRIDFGASIHDNPFKSESCSTSLDKSGEPFSPAKMHKCVDNSFSWSWEANKMEVWYTSDTKSFYGSGPITTNQFNLFLTLDEITPAPTEANPA